MDSVAEPEIIELSPPPRPARPAGGGRLTLLVAVTALVVSVAALGLAYVDRGTSGACSSAWDQDPTKISLPPGWTVVGQPYYVPQGVYVTLNARNVASDPAGTIEWTCYGEGPRAARYLALIRAAAEGKTRVLSDFPKLGEETVALQRTEGSVSSGLFDVYWRRGDLVTYLQVADGVTPEGLAALATAVDSASHR